MMPECGQSFPQKSNDQVERQQPIDIAVGVTIDDVREYGCHIRVAEGAAARHQSAAE